METFNVLAIFAMGEPMPSFPNWRWGRDLNSHAHCWALVFETSSLPFGTPHLNLSILSIDL